MIPDLSEPPGVTEFLFSQADFYCERTDFSFFSEPLNLFSNLIFIVVGVIHGRLYAVRLPGRHYDYLFLIILSCCIGVGSALFHSFANRLSMIADTVPILTYLLSYLAVFLKNTSGLHIRAALRIYALFALLSGAGAFVPGEWVNGSQYYIGSFLMIAYLYICSEKSKLEHAKQLLFCTVFFGLSWTFRSTDQFLCPLLPVGTHFLWHLFIGVTLCYSMKFIYHQKSR